MQRDIHHARVGPEAVLRAVSVVDVPIEDQDALAIAARLQVARDDGHVVEQTEAHRPIPLGVMTGRAQRSEAVVDRAITNGIRQLDGGARGEPRGVEGIGRRGGVGVEMRHRPARACGHRMQKIPVVDTCDLVFFGGARGDPGQRRIVGHREQLLQHLQTLGPLGVTRTRIVKAEAGIDDEPGRTHGDFILSPVPRRQRST